MNWLRRRLAAWLGVDAALMVAATAGADVAAETEARTALTEQVLGLVKTNHGLAQALQAAIGQLNRNTVTMQRWSTESATLQEIERRHARKAAIEDAKPANGSGRILTLPPGSTL